MASVERAGVRPVKAPVPLLPAERACHGGRVLALQAKQVEKVNQLNPTMGQIIR